MKMLKERYEIVFLARNIRFINVTTVTLVLNK